MIRLTLISPRMLAGGLLILLAATATGLRLRPAPAEVVTGYPVRLSEFGFFQGSLADQVPAPGVVPYALNTPLFSDYAEKLRFVRLPPGAQVPYNDQEVLHFPVGTVIIKTFYYPQDARKPALGRTLMETRLLIHEAGGWKALAYHWDENQQDATLEVAGATRPITWTDASGKKRKLDYTMPNLNQCKGCHSYEGAMRPIGPSARQLNGTFAYSEGADNQLKHWQTQGILTGLPAELAQVPRVPVWSDPGSGDLNARARAWLDINCAHCHNAKGPASTTGLYLDIHQTEPGMLGVNKAPVAAGRGAGDLTYGIVPGKPEASILYFRMASTDPGIMMPEVGRKMVHTESMALIREWIAGMKPDGTW
ncbi:MAG: SO2930 family diheme c-type cytochrome [Bacteroidia bacterium]|nr:SO2930 family diheme c-type cytochrome [Bacteroidia bacterium]